MASKHKMRHRFVGLIRFEEKARLPSLKRRRRSEDPPIPSDPKLSLPFEEIGGRGSYFLCADSTHYLRRHVETIQIMSDSFARRRLTIDIQLPTDTDLGLECGHGEYIFWIPVTSITKSPPRSNIDLRDDHDRVVALLTRRENGLISLTALVDATTALLGKPPSPLLADLLRELIEQDGDRAEVACVLVEAAFKAEGVDLSTEACGAFAESLRILAGNTWVWVPFRGRAGERRVIKFHYDSEFSRPGLFRQRPRTRRLLVAGGEAEVACELELRERGDGNPYSAPRRVAARVAASTGLGAVNLGIESPYLVASDSYHLQVESPPGVETRDIDLFAELQSEATTDNWRRNHGIHLYVNRARLKAEGAGVALVTLRVGRRGYMTLSWLSAVLSAALLWLFDLTAKSDLASREATATVILFGPALLAALVVRPGEHPVATKLFAGVRLLVGLNGLLAVAAAAAAADVRPHGWSIEHAWFVYAVAASAIAAVVSVSWILSWDSTYRLASELREEWSSSIKYRRYSAVLVGLTGTVLVLGGRDVNLPGGVYVASLVSLVAACAFASFSYARLNSSAARFAFICVSLAVPIAGLAVANLIMNLTVDWEWQTLWLWVGGGALLAAAALLVQDVIRRLQGSDVDEDEVRADGQKERPFGIGELTPSAARVRRRAREVGAGIPDLLAPSAYHEVEPSPKLMHEAPRIYAALQEARDRKSALGMNGSSNGTRKDYKEEAEKLADRDDRDLIFLEV